jgi:mannose-1-phosphate guanylyltransferase
MIALARQRDSIPKHRCAAGEAFLAGNNAGATVAEQAREMQRQVPSIPLENYLIEPAPRGTASVVALAAAVLQKRDPQAVMAIQTSDHYIRNRN